MNLVTLFFYIFSGVMLFAGVMAVSSRHMVHAVLYLILAFFNAAGLFLLLQAELLAMMLVIVYVGAVAVLFLFVVMMLDRASQKPEKLSKNHKPLSIAIGSIILIEIILTMMGWDNLTYAREYATIPIAAMKSNTHLIGDSLYTYYVFPFQLAGLILFVAMIGAIVLTLREREGVRRQDIRMQHQRKASDTVTIVQVPIGRGLHQE